MVSTPAAPSPAAPFVTGKIFDTVIKVSVDPTRPLPLVCGLYAVENSEGVWLCAYYGANRGLFDYLPQKETEIDEAKLGIAFRYKLFIPKGQYVPADWDNFKRERFMVYGA